VSTDEPVRFGVVGGGWRAEYFIRLAALLPEGPECVGLAVRRPDVGEQLAARWSVPAFATPKELVAATSPDFMMSIVSWEANPAIVEGLVADGIPVLCESPPAPDIDGLRGLWARVGLTGLVQVAEQYLLMPMHAARLEAVRRGLIGEVSSVQVSTTHWYHAVSMIRRLLGVDFESATVSTRRFVGPLVDPHDRTGWTRDATAKRATTTIATIEFSSGRSGLYDFTDNQWHNHLRTRRLVVRGSHGEIADDRMVRLLDEETIVEARFNRRQAGDDLDLDGYDTAHISVDGQVLWRKSLLRVAPGR
jgi:predicted dehydrogenase